MTLSALWRARKSSVPCRVQEFVQVSWLLTSPKMARGMGSKDADNDIKGWDGLPIRSNGFANPKAGSPSQPAYELCCVKIFSGMNDTPSRMM